MKIAAAAVAALATLAASAFAADHLALPGATSAYYMLKGQAERIRAASDVDVEVDAVGTGQAMLDVIEGRTPAAVVTVPLADAVASARVAAWTSERRLLMVSQSLVYTPVPTLDPNGRPLAFVTMGAPSPQLARVIDYLASRPATRSALNR